MSVGAQMVVVRKAFVEHCISLVLGHPFECSWLDVSQTDVFHRSSPNGGSHPHSCRGFSVNVLVTEGNTSCTVLIFLSDSPCSLTSAYAAVSPAIPVRRGPL